MSAPSSVLLAGGGSGGHVSPLLSVADALRRRWPEVVITALGTAEGLEARLVPEHGYPLRTIPRVPMPRRPDVSLLRFPGALSAEIGAAAAVVLDVEADVIAGFGGYVSTAAYLAARRLRLPFVVHEANTRPGLANRLGARFTPYVGTTFAQTRLPHAVRTGLPLRREISTLDRTARRPGARAGFGLEPDRPTLLVTGGSLGAQRLNEAFAASVADLRSAGIQVLHLAGLGKGFDPGPAGPGEPSYVVLEYCDDMAAAYAAADAVVCRAGANTVCELTAVGLPAVYVPLPIGNGEQRLNAEPVVAAGGGLLVADQQLTADWVRGRLVPWLGDGEALASAGAAAASWGLRDGDERVADLIETAASGPKALARKGPGGFGGAGR
jgi:UDP-N-acetylglucosamine--N-acetylmuramyl-(pentapeptide) pyrophosphoryl-undecaprenol N-acetylglucosamine transferase